MHAHSVRLTFYAQRRKRMQRKLSLGLLVTTLCLVSSLMSLAQSSAAQSSPAQSTPLTAEEREFALKSLQATHDAFLQSISGLSEKQWKFKPAPDRWS